MDIRIIKDDGINVTVEIVETKTYSRNTLKMAQSQIESNQQRYEQAMNTANEYKTKVENQKAEIEDAEKVIALADEQKNG